LNKIIDGSIQSSDREKQLAKKILDDRKKANHVDVSKLTANEKLTEDKSKIKKILKHLEDLEIYNENI
jgi:acetolactate synthase small subunit